MQHQHRRRKMQKRQMVMVQNRGLSLEMVMVMVQKKEMEMVQKKGQWRWCRNAARPKNEENRSSAARLALQECSIPVRFHACRSCMYEIVMLPLAAALRFTPR